MTSSIDWAASGSGMEISTSRSWRGIVDAGAMLPASDPAALLMRDRGRLLDDMLAREAENGNCGALLRRSSSKGSGAEFEKHDAGRLRR